ncbi:MAG: phosphatase PAP2 family protein [Pseudomonadota bacterium]
MDETLLVWINQGLAHPWLDVFFTWASAKIGFALPVALLILAVSAWQFGWRGVKLWLLLAIVVGAADALGNLLKHMIAQPRPCYEVYELLRLEARCGANLTGMPSNHTLNFFTAAALLSVITRARAWTVVLFAVALAVGVSRIYLGKHYPSQVMASAVLGAAWGWLAAWLALKYFSFAAFVRARSQPAAHTP